MSKNSKELKEIGNTICELCTFLKKPDSLQIFEKADFTKLDRKLFSDTIYFLLDVNAPDLVKNQLETVLNQAKPHDVFLKEAFQILGQIKERYPWSKTRLTTCQKSHFRDPRPEQNKVVEFLKQLLSVTLFIVSCAEPGQKSTEELTAEMDNLEKQVEDLHEGKRRADLDLKTSRERLLQAEADFKTGEMLLRDSGITCETFDRATLLKCIHDAEGKLLEKIETCLERV